jgi:sucrose phosphorylase
MTMEALVDRIRPRLDRLYGERGQETTRRVLTLLDRHQLPSSSARASRWDERDAVLIAYGDQIRVGDGERHPLATLREFLCSEQLQDCLSTVHILPFCPFSSDDGFSVIDYRAVDPALGTWQDVEQLAEHFSLMFDLVLNHTSQHSRWFQGYLHGEEPYTRYFHEIDPSTNLSAVTRPRSLPLLSPFQTSRGTRHVWTTFSADQVDLNYAEPDVLLEMLDILLLYVRHGARFVRLDAIAYLWKQVGTSCIHLPETHEVVKLMRDVLDIVAPDVILLTETNVPHRENVSYFGDADEAHMVYQFSLPPLLLEAILSQDAGPLNQWLSNLEPTAADTTYFNFTASHDGVGVRPLEGLISDQRFSGLVEAVRQRGGLVSTKRNSDGTDSPYELNVSYVDALSDPADPDPCRHADRFLASQAIMLALRGIPGVYFHSLVGTPNDHAGVQETNHARRINRRKYQLDELRKTVHRSGSLQQRIYERYRRLLSVRRAQPAFHPDGAQTVWDVPDGPIVAFARTSRDGGQEVLVVANLSGQSREFSLAGRTSVRFARDLLARDTRLADQAVELAPYQVAWLEAGK